MKNTLMESRVRTLEEMMADLITTIEQTSLEMRESTERLERNTDRFRQSLESDTADFKEEALNLISRMEKNTADFKDATRASIDRMEKDTAKRKEDTDQEHRNLNKQLGEIANKQGRMTEDLVAPSICRVLREVVDCSPGFACGSLLRPRRTHPQDKSLLKEFDVIADCGDYVLVNETKSKLSPTDIDELMNTIQEVREYFPEFRDRKFIASLATLYADKSLIKFASRKGVLILAVGDELMDVMNEPGFKPAIF